MIDLATFKWLAAERVWMRQCSGPQLEIVIGGNEQAPDPGRVAVADEVLHQIEQVERVAKAYLDAFVDRPKFAPNSDWFLDSVEFGPRGDEPLDEFVAYFSLEDDDYGLWSVVLCRTSLAGINPVEIARRQP